MSQSDDVRSPIDVDVDSIADGVDRVLEVDHSVPREEIRETLEGVADEDGISEESFADALASIESTIGDIEESLATATETLEDATDAAGEGADLPLVRSRLSGLEADIEANEDTVSELLDEHQELLDRLAASGPTYELATDAEALEQRARAAADQVSTVVADVETVSGWIHDPNEKLDELQVDAEEIDSDLEEVDLTRGHVHAITIDGTISDEKETEALIAWTNGTMRLELIRLGIEDIRWELEQLRSVGEHVGVALQNADALVSELDELEDRRAELATELEELEYPTWTGQYETILWSFEDQMDEEEPPVDWEHVKEEFEEHRSAIIDSTM